jgi:hypothetical protein
MEPPRLRKGTQAAVTLVPQFRRDGALEVLAVIKERFAVDPYRGVTRVGDARVEPADVPWDEDAPATSSVRLPADLCGRKPGTDVIVVGHACAPDGAARSLDVTVRVGPVFRALRVHGLRVWYRGATGLALTPPQPFARVPLRWELAFGGSDRTDPERPLEDPRNPLGRSVARDVSALVDTPGPQIEDPDAPFSAALPNPAPVGVAPIGRHWLPRRRYAGTYDAAWQRTRMPLPPDDFDDRFHQCAAPGMVCEGHLRGGERVELLHLHPAGALGFDLPRLHFFVGIKALGGALVEHPAALDTVLLRPTEGLLELTWRALLPTPRRILDVDYVQVHEKVLR